MTVEVNGKSIATDNEGYLLTPEDWDTDVAKALIRQHESAGHKKITETGWELINYFREYYDDHMKHPSMHQLLVDRARLENKNFSDEKIYKNFLYGLFPHEPVRMLCKLAGLPKPTDEVET